MADESLNFLARLKQHHLYGVVVAYAVVVGFLIQLVSRAFPYFGWAEAVPTVIIVLLLGFPVVVVLAWLFIKPKDPAKSSTWQRRHWKLSAVVTVVVIVLVVVSGFYGVRFSEHRAERLALSGVTPTVTVPKAANTAASSAVTVIPAKSIAVLPFENLSADKNNAYFADGMQDLILTKLADIGDLDVTSRTSTLQYGSHPQNLKAIAQQLGVATILEGSVQKAGNQVLINVQLIDAATDRHLWAESYTRTLDNIFGVEGEVAQKIADALKAKLTPTEAAAVAKVPTHNKQAYDAYLKGVYYLDDSNRTGDTAELAQSVPLFKQAVQFDPQFADAWAYLSLAYEKLGGQHKAQAAAALRALEIDPNNASALGVMSFVYSDEGQHDKAIALAERAVKLQTKNANVQAGLGFILMFAGRFDDAINIFEHAVALTPNTSTFRLFLAYPLEATRDYMQARDQLQTGLAHDPGDMSSVQMLAQVDLLGWGDLDAARKVLQAASQSPNRSIPLAEAWYQVDLYAREYAAALDVINHAPEQMFQQSQTPKAQYLAQVYQAQDDAVRTKIAFGQARTQLETWLKATPNSADLHANLALTLAGLGDIAQSQAEAERAVVLSPVARNAWEGQEYLLTQAQVQARIGHVGMAVEQLQHLLQIPAGSFISIPILKFDPAWDPIRKDPRFQALLEKYENTNHNSGSANGE